MRLNKPRRLVQRLHPLRTHIGYYVQHALRPDLAAGLTVAMVAVPQGMSYAAIAGVNPLYGLHTAIIPAIVGALLGSSNHLITGPTNATALATAGVLLALSGQADYVEYVFAMAVITGLIRLILGLFRLGSIIRYVSSSVLTGFLAGAGILIIINQLHTLLGLARPVGANTLTILWDLVQHSTMVNPHVLATGLFAIGVLLLSQRINRRVPRALLAIVLAGVLVQVTGWNSRGVALVKDVSSLDQVRLAFHVPAIPLQQQFSLLASGGAVALLSLVEAMSIANVVALASNQRVNPSREFVGQGLASVIGGFFQCIPSSGSLARSAVSYNSGAKTRLAGVFSGVFVLFASLAFSRLIGFIPVAGLAGIVTLSAYSLLDYRHLKLTWQSRATNRIVLSVTLIATLLLPLHLAIFLGTLLSIGVYLHESSNIRLSYLTLNVNGNFVEHSLEDCIREQPAIALINLEGVLYFAAADDLENKLNAVLKTGTKVLILRVRRLRLLAGSGVTALRRIFDRAKQLGATILICGVTDEVNQFLESSGLKAVVGINQTFRASEALFESTHKALRRAREIVPEEE
jgi:SulP family sulfate permease